MEPPFTSTARIARHSRPVARLLLVALAMGVVSGSAQEGLRAVSPLGVGLARLAPVVSAPVLPPAVMAPAPVRVSAA
ncbi:MAG: hypothetical protein WCJ30_03765, partial [Deltaproteobacteria bacterium]